VIDKTAFERSERIQTDWLEAHLLPPTDMLERIWLRTQAKSIANEIVLTEFIHLKTATALTVKS